MSERINLSILMPVYNEEKYIFDAVNSIFSLDYGELDIELIVVDDQSTDSTYEIVQKLSNKNSKIKLLKNSNKGKNNALNLAYLNSTGQYICLMGGDDLIEPKTLFLRVKAITNKNKTSHDLIYSCCKIKTFSEVKKYDSIIIPRAGGKGSTSGGAITLTRSLCNKIFPIPPNLPNEDSWISHYLEFFSIERVEAPQIGLYYRIHENNSHKRGIPFEEYRDQMWARSRSILMFYDKYYHELTYQQEEKLLKSIQLELAVYLQDYSNILLFNKLSIRKKIVALSRSSKILYKVKNKFYNHITGR